MLTVKCGGNVKALEHKQYVKSQNYDLKYPQNVYEVGIECVWRISTVPGRNVVWGLEGDFGMYMYSDVACYHWLEVRYKKAHVYQGPR